MRKPCSRTRRLGVPRPGEHSGSKPVSVHDWRGDLITRSAGAPEGDPGLFRGADNRDVSLDGDRLLGPGQARSPSRGTGVSLDLGRKGLGASVTGVIALLLIALSAIGARRVTSGKISDRPASFRGVFGYRLPHFPASLAGSFDPTGAMHTSSSSRSLTRHGSLGIAAWRSASRSPGRPACGVIGRTG